MQFTDEVSWSAFDFVFAGALMFGALGAYEVAARMTGNTAYRTGVGVAIVAAFLLVWINGAVGILGSEDNPANVLYGGVLTVGVVGALVARFRPHGMARALAATALAQAAVAVGALVAGWGSPGSGPFEVVALNGFFVALWVGSAVLFREAAREQPPANAGPER